MFKFQSGDMAWLFNGISLRLQDYMSTACYLAVLEETALGRPHQFRWHSTQHTASTAAGSSQTMIVKESWAPAHHTIYLIRVISLIWSVSEGSNEGLI